MSLVAIKSCCRQTPPVALTELLVKELEPEPDAERLPVALPLLPVLWLTLALPVDDRLPDADFDAEPDRVREAEEVFVADCRGGRVGTDGDV